VARRRRRGPPTIHNVRSPKRQNLAQRRYGAGDKFGDHLTVLGYVGLRDSINPEYPASIVYRVQCSCGDQRLLESTNIPKGCKCRACMYLDREGQRVPRLCQWCGRDDAQAGFKRNIAQTCSACLRCVPRHGRYPCGKPRRKWVCYLPVEEHVCEQCEPWTLSAAAVEELANG